MSTLADDEDLFRKIALAIQVIFRQENRIVNKTDEISSVDENLHDSGINIPSRE